MRRSIGLAGAIVAAGMLHGLAKPETPEEREARAARDKEPPDRSPRYVGVDYGREPGRVVTQSRADLDRIAAAEAKRARKAEKLLRLRPASAPAAEDVGQ